MKRRLPRARWAIATAIAVLVALGGGVASAYWAATGSGSGSAITGTLAAPTAVSVPAVSGNTVHVTWTASTGTPSPAGYYVTRTDQATSSTEAACGTSPTSTLTATSCDDTSVASGNYLYTVTAVYRSWTASAVSDVVTVRTASRLAFTTPPSTTVAGSAISPAVAVTVEDASGAAVPVSGRQIAIAIGTNPGGATLSGTLTANTDANGVATFGSLSLDRVATGYNLVATSTSLTSGTSVFFAVTAATGARFVITSLPVSGAASATATLGPITIQRQDAFGNAVTGPAAIVNLVSTTTGTPIFATTLGGPAVTFVTIPAGQPSVDVYYGDTKAGTPTITASGSLTSATQIETISAGTATKFATTSPAVNGPASTTAALGPITIERQDAFGNPATVGSTSVTLASNSTGTKVFSLTLKGAAVTSAVISASQSSVTVFYGDTKAGSPTITASGSLASVTQIQTITLGLKLCFVLSDGTLCPTASQNVNGTFTARIALVDSLGNLVVTGIPIPLTLGATGKFQVAPGTSTIDAGSSVTAATFAITVNGANKSGVVTGHATTIIVPDASLDVTS